MESNGSMRCITLDGETEPSPDRPLESPMAYWRNLPGGSILKPLIADTECWIGDVPRMPRSTK